MSNITNITDDFFSITIGEGDDLVDIGMMFDGVTDIERDIGNSWVNSLNNGSGRYGFNHERTTLSKKTISIQFEKTLSPNEMSLWREELFYAVDCPNGPRKLKFNDQPNRYYNVLIDGEINFTYDIGTRKGVGKLNFLVPDGLAHLTYTKVLNKDTTDPEIGSIVFNNDGSVTCKVNNKGNVDIYPTITITNKTENDYIGIASIHGVMELGNKSDPSGMSVIDNTSVTLADIKSGDTSSTTGWGLFTDTPNRREPFMWNFAQEGGLLKYGTTNPNIFGSGMIINKFGSTIPVSNWHGGFKKFKFPINPATGTNYDPINFDIIGVMKLWQSKMGQTGMMTISVVDKNDIGIMNYTLYKADIKGDETRASFRRNISYPEDASKSESKGENSWKEIRFGANNNEAVNNKNPNVAFNWAKGQYGMSKNGGYLTWIYNGVKHTMFAPELQNAKADAVYIGIGQLINKGPTGPIQVMVHNSINIIAKNISAYKASPNLYAKNSKNKIDMSSGNVYYSSDPSATKGFSIQNGDLVDGSEPFSFPKGITEIQIFPSSWAQENWKTSKPDIEIEWIENFG